MPTAAENDISANFFLPEFIQQFLPDRNSLESLLDPRYFTRAAPYRWKSLWPWCSTWCGQGSGWATKRSSIGFSRTPAWPFPRKRLSNPPIKRPLIGPGRKLPVEVFQILFAQATEYAQTLARQHSKLTWNGFRVYAIDGTKKNLPHSEELLDFFEAPSHAHFPQMITGVLFDVLAKVAPQLYAGPL